ncbi:MAG: thymidylate synthase [PVC group bacterium]|nr:thymidylate synthase [PVC group bacterium]
MQNPVYIKGTNLPDIWYQTLYKIIEVGRDFKIDKGSNAGQKRKEYDFVMVHAKCPGLGELLPKLNPALNLDDPCAQDFLDDYMPYLMTGEEKEGESYTYGQRICKSLLGGDFLKPINLETEKIIVADQKVWMNKDIIVAEPSTDSTEGAFYLDQMEMMIWMYTNKGIRNNQMIMQVGQPTDMLLQDPPCLRHIDTRIQDDALHFYPYFRSWDLWGGFPANLAAIELMRQYCAEQIGLDPTKGEIIATSKGLHLYNYVWKIAETVRGKTSEEFKSEMSEEGSCTSKGLLCTSVDSEIMEPINKKCKKNQCIHHKDFGIKCLNKK